MGAGVMGTRMGPDAIRLTWFMDILRELGFDIRDLGNINIQNLYHYSNEKFDSDRMDIILPAISELADMVESSIDSNRFPLVLGGDHTLVAGSFSGVLRAVQRPGLIYFDAHADINTKATSISGNLHGVPVAELMELDNTGLLPINRPRDLRPEDVVYIGLNDLDPGEEDIIQEHDILAFMKRDVDELGMTKVIEEAIDKLADCDGIYISLDVDSIDRTFAPGTGLPNRDGLIKSDVIYALNKLSDQNLIGIEFVEVNPLRDNNNQTANLVKDMILATLSGDIL